ncbi:MAG TPA: leucyl aminopeptidase [Tepidisphaeraceae bacterium]|jgi:leucyl aminopeptidase|nr:leucyl aminopeptidase [Tepidisphaeraceae bacterium]
MVPTSTDFSISVKDSAPANVEATIVFIEEGQAVSAGIPGLGDADRAALDRLSASGVVRGKAKEIAFDVIDVGPGKFRRLFAVGLGKRDKLNAETLRQAAGRVVRALRKHRLAKANVFVPAGAVALPQAAEALVVGALLAAFDFEEYKGTGQKKDDAPKPKRMEWTLIAGGEDGKAAREAVERGRAIADGQNFARTIASRPGNDINPLSLAKVAQAMAREVGLTCRVLDEKEMAKLGMGGILAVGGGSIATPPRMIVLEHGGKGSGKKGKANLKSGSSNQSPLLVVGKAITFDTGGISIKPADKMGKMIFDKCGGMAVLGLMYAAAKLKLPMHVIGILSSAENAVSSRAYRPGDILRMYNGVTVDVTNTDAEGRLVLGDALAWGIETYKPSAVVDLATLTGGVVTALGKSMAGVMSNSDEIVRELNVAAEAAGEKMWRLPLGEEQRDQIRGDAADIVNSAGREAHPLQGGAFLSFFVPMDGSMPWAHLDIAGPADTEKELPYYAKGATGWGVRTLVEWVTLRASKK